MALSKKSPYWRAPMAAATRAFSRVSASIDWVWRSVIPMAAAAVRPIIRTASFSVILSPRLSWIVSTTDIGVPPGCETTRGCGWAMAVALLLRPGERRLELLAVVGVLDLARQILDERGRLRERERRLRADAPAEEGAGGGVRDLDLREADAGARALRPAQPRVGARGARVRRRLALARGVRRAEQRRGGRASLEQLPELPGGDPDRDRREGRVEVRVGHDGEDLGRAARGADLAQEELPVLELRGDGLPVLLLQLDRVDRLHEGAADLLAEGAVVDRVPAVAEQLSGAVEHHHRGDAAEVHEGLQNGFHVSLERRRRCRAPAPPPGGIRAARRRS